MLKQGFQDLQWLLLHLDFETRFAHFARVEVSLVEPEAYDGLPLGVLHGKQSLAPFWERPGHQVRFSAMSFGFKDLGGNVLESQEKFQTLGQECFVEQKRSSSEWTYRVLLGQSPHWKVTEIPRSRRLP